MTNEELDELEFYMNIELKINDMTIILKNIDILSLNNVNKYDLIRSVMCDVDWYTVELYGTTTILNEFVPALTLKEPSPFTLALLSSAIAVTFISVTSSFTLTVYSVTSLLNSGVSSLPSTVKDFKLLLFDKLD